MWPNSTLIYLMYLCIITNLLVIINHAKSVNREVLIFTLKTEALQVNDFGFTLH